MNKKGAEMPMNVVVLAALLGVFLVVMLMYQGKVFAGARVTFSEADMKKDVGLCKFRGETSKGFTDKDFGASGDGYPDSCDFCLGGNEEKDTDADGIPDACDNDLTSTPKKDESLSDICSSSKKGVFTAGTFNQCKLNCYDKKLCPKA